MRYGKEERDSSFDITLDSSNDTELGVDYHIRLALSGKHRPERSYGFITR